MSVAVTGHARGTVLLDVDAVSVGYGVVPVVRDVSLSVCQGEAVALLGANGAGKSTLLKGISGLMKLGAGVVRFGTDDLAGIKAEALVERGLSHVAEGRRIFRRETVLDNLLLGMYRLHLSKGERASRVEEAFDLFPALRVKAADAAGALSGGQQQMLAIAQALVRRPQLIMLDEPSLGLAPILVEEVFTILAAVRQRGVAVLLVEQVVERALEFVDYAYLLQSGRLTAQGTPAELARTDVVRQAYLGGAPVGAAA